MRPATTAFVLSLGLAAAGAAEAQVSLVNPDHPERLKPGISISGSSISRSGAAEATPKLQPGQVLFSVKNADLRREVLPLFQEQAGIKIRWIGPPRKVSLRLVEPVDWEDALQLVSQFTNTHLSAGPSGSYLLRDKWGGDAEGEAYDDLDGQLDTPDHQRTVRASVPVVRPRKIPTIKLGGGVLRMGPANARRPRQGPRRIGPARVARPRVGPKSNRRPRVGPRKAPGARKRIGPRRTGPRVKGPARRQGPGRIGARRTSTARPNRAPRNGPRRTGPRRPWPSF